MLEALAAAPFGRLAWTAAANDDQVQRGQGCDDLRDLQPELRGLVAPVELSLARVKESLDLFPYLDRVLVMDERGGEHVSVRVEPRVRLGLVDVRAPHRRSAPLPASRVLALPGRTPMAAGGGSVIGTACR